MGARGNGGAIQSMIADGAAPVFKSNVGRLHWQGLRYNNDDEHVRHIPLFPAATGCKAISLNFSFIFVTNLCDTRCPAQLCGELRFGAVDLMRMDERYSVFLDRPRVGANLTKSGKHKDLMIVSSRRVSNAWQEGKFTYLRR